jgi:hypothetical protein
MRTNRGEALRGSRQQPGPSRLFYPGAPKIEVLSTSPSRNQLYQLGANRGPFHLQPVSENRNSKQRSHQRNSSPAWAARRGGGARALGEWLRDVKHKRPSGYSRKGLLESPFPRDCVVGRNHPCERAPSLHRLTGLVLPHLFQHGRKSREQEVLQARHKRFSISILFCSLFTVKGFWLVVCSSDQGSSAL